MGQSITQVGGTASSVRANSHRIVGATVERIRTRGKHLVVDLSGGYSIRVHLGMSGRWIVVGPDDDVPGSARLVLSARGGSAVCLAAPTVEVGRTPAIDLDLGRLGPDILGDFDPDEFVARARSLPSTAIGDMLLNQTVIAGIGNVYKSELLFLAGIDPHARLEEISDEQLLDLAADAVRLMAANVGPKPRTMTGWRSPDRETWVYGRRGRPCHRCGTAIEMDHQGDRITYWCPQCQ